MALSDLPPIFLGLFAGMDTQGEQILGTYLYGGDKPHTVSDDPQWSAYMMANDGLRRQIFGKLILVVKDIAARKKKGRHPITETFHAECPENGDLFGYALLHGTNSTVGDFQLFGWADVQEAIDPAPDAYDIELELWHVFNDIVDPNSKYLMDRIRSVAVDAVLGAPDLAGLLPAQRNYRLTIKWASNCLAEIRPGKPTFFSGYPSDNRRGVITRLHND
jgi:hypothetical protein